MEEVVHTVPSASLDVFFMDDIEVFVRIFSWNIEGAIIPASADNYRVGGTMTRPEKETYQDAIQGVIDIAGQYAFADILLFQTVDTSSGRSFYINQHEMIASVLPEHGHGFSLNNFSPFVAWPVFTPEGKIESGISMFSKLPFENFSRVALPQVYLPVYDPFTSTPCFQYARFSLRNGTYLVVLNISNSIFEMHPQHRLTQMLLIKSLMLDEYQRGNFVVAGGSWYLCPVGYKLAGFETGHKGSIFSSYMDKDFFPYGWQYAFDNQSPGYRWADTTYLNEQSKVSIVDYFIVSPNVEIHNCKTLNQDFLHSNHNPLMLEIYIPLREELPEEVKEEE